MNPRRFKVVLLGDASVGKSSLIIRFVKNTFSETIETTIGAAFFTKVFQVDGERIKLDVWDTAGQERFASLAPMYYRGASAAIVVFDRTEPKTFDRAKKWASELLSESNGRVVIALVANKLDLAPDLGLVGEARQFADANGIIFVEASAKTGENVDHLFRIISRRLPEAVSPVGSTAHPSIKVGTRTAARLHPRWCCPN